MSSSIHAHRKKGISPILATIILIVITVVAGVMLYGFVTGFFSSSATANNANLEASLTMPSGAQAGTFVMTVKDAGTTSIKAINITLNAPNGTPIFEASWSGLVSPGQEVTIYGSGTKASASTGTPAGASNITAINVISGESYNYIVTITFANGATKTYTGSVTASAF